MRRTTNQSDSGEWGEWSADAAPWSQPAPPARPAQPPAGPPMGHMGQPQPYMYQPPAAASPFMYQAPAPVPTPTTHAPAAPQTTPMPAPYIPQTGSTGNFMMPGMTSGPGMTGGGMGMGGGMMGGMATPDMPARPEALDVSSLATGVASGVAAMAGVDNTTASFAGQMASQAAMKGMEEMTRGMAAYSRLNVLRYYFDVNNAYVLSKIKILMLPYRHKEWERKVTTGPGGQYTPRPPSEDPNAPDLYLPLMSYVTYILVAGFVSGADGRFTPEVLASTASTGLVIVCLEVGAIKLGLYLMQSSGSAAASALDLCAVSGYKFLAAVLCVLVKALLGTLCGYVAIVATGASVGTFMAKTLHQSLLEGSGFSPGFMTEGMGSPGKQKRKQNYSLLGVALLQPLFFWYLSRV